MNSNDELEGMWKEVMSYFKARPIISGFGGKPREHLSQDSLSPCRDLNSRSSEFQAGIITQTVTSGM
jgi:hypothetical protein